MKRAILACTFLLLAGCTPQAPVDQTPFSVTPSDANQEEPKWRREAIPVLDEPKTKPRLVLDESGISNVTDPQVSAILSKVTDPQVRAILLRVLSTAGRKDVPLKFFVISPLLRDPRDESEMDIFVAELQAYLDNLHDYVIRLEERVAALENAK